MPDVLVVIGPATSPPKKSDLSAVGFGRGAAEKAGGDCDVLLMGPQAAQEGQTVARLGWDRFGQRGSASAHTTGKAEEPGRSE